MKLCRELILINIMTKHLNNRSMNLQLKPSPPICRATRMEEHPKVTLDIQCLQGGGGVASTSTINYFLHREVMAAHGL